MKRRPIALAYFSIFAACGDGTTDPVSDRAQTIAFVSDRSGYGIYRMQADGSNVQPIVRTEQLPFCLSWSPDGSHIVFSQSQGMVDQVFVVDVSTARLTQLTSGELPSTCPAWSPAGDRIAYYAGLPDPEGGATPRDYGLFLMDPDGRNATRLGGDVFRPNRLAWSPDGRRIASGLVNEDDRIVFVDARTGARLGALGTRGFDITWSPDGRRLAYIDQRGAGTEIYVVNADGSGERQVGRDGPNQVEASLGPRWSPDGRWLAVDQIRERPPLLGSREIVLVDPDGADERVLTRDVHMDISPDWRPAR